MERYQDSYFNYGRDIANEYIHNFQTLHGKLKVKELIEKVERSKVLKKLIFLAQSQRAKPNGDDFVSGIMNMMAFTFAKPDIISVAALIALLKWDSNVNAKQELYNQLELAEVVKQIILRCDQMKF